MRVTLQARLYITTILVVFIDALLYGIIVPAVPYYAQKFQATETEVGLIFFAYSAGLLFTSIPFGMLSDRVGRKKVLVVGALGLSFSTLAYMFSTTFSALIASRLLQGIASSATWTSGLAIATELFPASVRGQKLGLVLSASGIGIIVGPAFGGFLFEYMGYMAPFAVVAVIALVPLVLMVKKEEESIKEESNRKIPSKFAKVLNNRTLLWGTITVFAASFGFGVVDPILPLHLSNNFGLTSNGIGIIFAVLSLSYTISQPLMGGISDKKGRKRTMVTGIILTAVFGPFITVAPSLVMEVFLIGLLGAVTATMMAPCLPLMAESIEGENKETGMYGLAFGVLNTAYSVGLATGPLIGGLLTERFNFTSAMIFHSVLLAAVAFGVSLKVRETI